MHRPGEKNEGNTDKEVILCTTKKIYVAVTLQTTDVWREGLIQEETQKEKSEEKRGREKKGVLFNKI